MAKALAGLLFGDEDKIIRYDMSEFYGARTVANFIGTPQGYVGYEEGGGLVKKIIENPKNVLLFDEIEKAHPKIFHIFLQMLDEGRLTDGKGNTADFRDTYIIFTSNLGQELLDAGIGFTQDNKESRER